MAEGWRIRHSRETVVMVSPLVAEYVATRAASVGRCHVSRVGNGELPDGVRRGQGRVLDGCRWWRAVEHCAVEDVPLVQGPEALLGRVLECDHARPRRLRVAP